MDITLSQAIHFLDEEKDKFIDDLKLLGAIPSISTDSNSRESMFSAAAWLSDHLTKIGLHNSQIMPTNGYPVVYAEYLEAGPSKPTLLIYGHYDVQPADPLNLWESDAFNPQIRGDYIYGRGVSDMKGQVLATVNAVEACLVSGCLPINIKFLLEGEEEIGSPSLREFLHAKKDCFSCDLALNPDTGMLGPDDPTITFTLRGMAGFEITVQGPSHDLHSGTFGGVVHNPAQALSELIASMHDSNGSITLPGFYDPVRPLSPDEVQELNDLKRDETFFRTQTGAPALWGEPEYSPYERTCSRPTLEVNGLYSGYAGEGSKTVIPATATAKLSMRLVPDQDPVEVHQQLLAHLEKHAPKTIKYEVKYLKGNRAAISARDSDGVKAMSKALETVWGRKPSFKREGGSVPVVTLFQDILGIESVNSGFSLPGDNMHSPNERLHLPSWHKGMKAFVHFFNSLG
jgi:acetylornithine deacetylase/succinyl-diaminopimelate desuccinylase-like protein